MQRHYSSLADSKYLPQLLCLYESLVKHSSEPFKLWILPLDDNCWYALRNLSLPDVELIALDGFVERMGLEGVRASRTHQEWCWTLASQVCEDLMTECGLPEITYLDADTFCFADLAPVFKEIGNRSIAITPHRFPDNPQKARLEKSGKYNVGFVHFKNTDAGRSCLATWAANVRDRCSAEVGCGDQCYLDSFESDFGDEVAMLGHGINTGPWNLMAYEVTHRDGVVSLGDDPLILYHMHEYVHGERLTNYPLRPEDIRLIYDPYIAANCVARERIASALAYQ